jgi:cell division protein ZapA
MESLSVKIKISDREYPLKIKPEEEEGIRKTAKLINQKIKAFKDQYGIEDKQDLLAMVLFEVMVDVNRYESSIDKIEEFFDEQMEVLSRQ